LTEAPALRFVWFGSANLDRTYPPFDPDLNAVICRIIIIGPVLAVI
jgi:hypothetical protein